MKFRTLSLIATLFLLAACSKDVKTDNENMSRVSFEISLSASESSRALTYPDGDAAQVDNWVVEVRDVLNPNVIFYREVKAGNRGVKVQKFDLSLVKNHTYDIAFWADKAGCWKTDDLSAVELKELTLGNLDDYDAFSACVRHTVQEDKTISARLYRPLSQINIMTTDLPLLKASSTAEAYAQYAPTSFHLGLTAPTKYNVYTEAASEEQSIDITPVALVDKCYGDYLEALNPTTLFMAYVLSNKYDTQEGKDVRELNFKFSSANVGIEYDFQNIPLRRNWRTNIIGRFMTNSLEWNVEIIPAWSGEENVEK